MRRKRHSTFTLFTLWIVLVIQHLTEQYFLLRNKYTPSLMDCDQAPPRWKGAKSLQQTCSELLADKKKKRAKHKHEMHPTRVFSKNCGMIFHTIRNAPVVPSEKQALTNILKVFFASVWVVNSWIFSTSKHTKIRNRETGFFFFLR